MPKPQKARRSFVKTFVVRQVIYFESQKTVTLGLNTRVRNMDYDDYGRHYCKRVCYRGSLL